MASRLVNEICTWCLLKKFIQNVMSQCGTHFQHELKRIINFYFDHGDVSLTLDRKVLEKQMSEAMAIVSGNLIISHERVLGNTRQPMWCPIIWMDLEEEYIEMLGQDKTFKCKFIYILYEIQWHWLIEWSSFIRCAIFMNLTLRYTMKYVFNIARSIIAIVIRKI